MIVFIDQHSSTTLIATLHLFVCLDVSAVCLDRSVIAVCQAFPRPINESEAIVMITLSANDSLMCVESYKIHFNGENKTVPVNSPEANFTISSEEVHLSFQGEIYLLDFEENSGELPCDFNIPGESFIYNFLTLKAMILIKIAYKIVFYHCSQS